MAQSATCQIDKEVSSPNGFAGIGEGIIARRYLHANVCNHSDVDVCTFVRLCRKPWPSLAAAAVAGVPFRSVLYLNERLVCACVRGFLPGHEHS